MLKREFRGFVVPKYEEYPLPLLIRAEDNELYFWVQDDFQDHIEADEDFFLYYKEEYYETIEDFKNDKSLSLRELFERIKQ